MLYDIMLKKGRGDYIIMEKVNENEQMLIVGGWKATVYCPNYGSGYCKKDYTGPFGWKKGKSTFTYWTAVTYVKKWYERWYGPRLACHSHDCDLF